MTGSAGSAGSESGSTAAGPAGGTSSVVGVEGALRARDVSRPRPEHLAAAERLPVRTADGRVLPPELRPETPPETPPEPGAAGG